MSGEGLSKITYMATVAEGWPETFEKDVSEIAEMIYNLSGDWVTPINCDTILDEESRP